MFCGIDVGTTNIKFLIFDESFNVVFSKRTRTPIIKDKKQGDLLSAKKLIDEILTFFKMIPESLKGKIKVLGISSMGETIFPIAEDGSIISDGMMWYNDKVMDEFKSFTDRISTEFVFKKTGLWPSWIFSVFKMMNFYRKHSEASSKIYKWLDVSSFLAYVLTGNVGMDKSLSSRTLLVNVKTGDWDKELLEISEIPRKHLPEIVNCGINRGTIRKKIAEQIGISKNVVVTTAGQDHITASYAVGVHGENKVLNSSGTTEAVLWTVEKETMKRYIEKAPKIFQGGFHCIPEKYYVLGGIPTGGFCIEWLINKILKTSYSIFNGFKYEKSSVYFFPYLRGIFDRSDFRGAFLNLKDSDDQNSIISAILEAIAFEIKSYLKKLEELGLGNYEIVAVGGGTRLKEILKIKASIFKVPIKVLNNYESTALGAAMVSAITTGDFESWDFIPKNVTNAFEVFYPDNDNYFEEKYMAYLELRKKLYGF